MLVFLASCTQAPDGPVFALEVLPVSPVNGAGGRSSTTGGLPTIRAEVVSTLAARNTGLSGRPSLGGDEGMLFVYPQARQRQFWMKDCHFPLDIAFLGEDGTVLGLSTLPPGVGLPYDEVPRVRSPAPTLYVLETNGGWFREHGLGAGDRIDLSRAVEGVKAR